MAGDTVRSASSSDDATFQFTPARGGRRSRNGRCASRRRFNSRPRVAGDRRVCGERVGAAVSIHARAWRATQLPRTMSKTIRFQFTPARGGRPAQSLDVWHLAQFQFTPARGGRQKVHGDNSMTPRFQFTPARGGRPLRAGAPIRSLTFQFTPARGGRPHRIEAAASLVNVSIHARAWRATMSGS